MAKSFPRAILHRATLAVMSEHGHLNTRKKRALVEECAKLKRAPRVPEVPPFYWNTYGEPYRRAMEANQKARALRDTYASYLYDGRIALRWLRAADKAGLKIMVRK